MSLGKGSIGVNQKRPVVGPPFPATSAENGLSVASNGRIVLGNDLNDAAMPARLLSSRQIDISNGRFIRLKQPDVRGDETVELGGVGVSYEWRGANLDVFDRQRLPIRLFMPRTGAGTITGIAIGNSGTVDVELSHINSETFGPKGGVVRVRNNSADASLSNLSLECLATNGNIYFRNGSPLINRARLYPSGNFVFADNTDLIADGSVRLRVRAALGQATLLLEDSTGVQVAQMSLNGNLRIGVGADAGTRLQVRGAVAAGIVRFEDSAGSLVFGIDSFGNVTITNIVPAAGPGHDVLLVDSTGTVVKVTGLSTSFTTGDGTVATFEYGILTTIA